MPDTPNHHHGSIGGAIVLIALGGLFLYGTLHPDFHVWPFLGRYWPLILIFLGLGKLWDYYWDRTHPGSSHGGELSGLAVALLILVLIAGLAFWFPHQHRWRSFDHETQSEVDRQGAESVQAKIDMPAGMLDLSGGAEKLLEADFDTHESWGTPRVEYSVNGGVGQLNIQQEEGSNFHFGTSDNTWRLHLSDDVPLDLSLNMGAGQGQLRLRGLNLTHLRVEMGAGQLDLDLTGSRKQDFQADIQGGVGQATIHLPKNVGVQVHASGGIGAVNARGLKRDGETYINDAYGKTPVTIKMNIEGGVGTINLDQES